MSFNSLEFGFFLALVLACYFWLPHRAQNRMLLVASYVFYAAWDWRFCSLLLLSTTVDYFVGLWLVRTDVPARRRQLLGLSLATNLGILGFFKYAGFFADGLSTLLGVFGIELAPFVLDVVLPVGISFYTFQTLSYTIDVYRRHLEPTRSFLDFALFVSFFPQLVAGPIERATRLLPQIASPRRFDVERASSGAWLVLWGLYKKVVVADNLAVVVDAVFRPGAEPTAAEIAVACWIFSWQIYCDFSGYSDIARGVARILGFELMLNFRLPFAAVNPADFWRRWHISLSTWLRDYLFLSLGGSSRGAAVAWRNLFVVMVMAGVWHGAGGTYLLWGVYWGVLMVGHAAYRSGYPIVGARERPLAARALSRASRCFLLFQALSAGWLLFRAESLAHSAALVATLLGPFEVGQAIAWLRPFAFLAGPLVAMQLVQSRTGDLETVLRWPLPLRTACYVFLLLMILFVGDQIGQPFVYFQF